jgi:hypothetical protein
MERPSAMRVSCLGFCAAAVTVAIAVGCLTAPAQAQQQRPPQKPKTTVPSLAAQGFEVKAALSSYLVLQKGKDVWLCYMLQVRSTCEPAE